MMRSLVCAALVPVAACVAAAQDAAPQPEQAKVQQVVDTLKRDGLLGNGVYGDDLYTCDFSALITNHIQLYMSGKEGIQDFPWLPVICRAYKAASKPISKEVVKLLLDAGVDLNASQDVFSLIIEDYDKQDPELIDLLLAAGLELNSKLPPLPSDLISMAMQSQKQAPLSLALLHNKKELAKKLLDAGASPNANIRLGKEDIPLISFAILSNQPECVRMLIEAGADVNVKSDKDLSPLEYACSSRGLEAARAVVPMLEAAGAQAREDKCSPLIRACIKDDVEAVKKMIEHGLEVNKPDEEGFLPLMYVAAVGNKDICSLLVSAGADVNASGMRGLKTLNIAVILNRLDIVDYLLSNGAQIEVGNDNRVSTLLLAVLQKGCSEEMVKRLIAAGAKVNNIVEGGSPILSAAIGQNKHLVDMLIEAGADVDAQREDDSAIPSLSFSTPLKSAVAVGDIQLCEKLLNHGAKINSSNSFALLYNACQVGQRDIFNMLVKHGADVNAPDEDGETLLSKLVSQYMYGSGKNYASMREKVMLVIQAGANVNETLKNGRSLFEKIMSNLYLCELLVDAGAELNDEDESGMIMFEKAVSEGNAAMCNKLIAAGLKVKRWRPLPLAAVLGQVDKVKELLAAGARPDMLHKRRTILTYAARMGNVEVCKALIEAGANVNAVDPRGWTPLSAAAAARHAEVCRLLLDSGADVSIKWKDDPLIFSAILPCNDQVVEMLIDAGADVSAKDCNECTPLMVAVSKCMSTSVIRKMIQAGADAQAVDKYGNSALHYNLVPNDIIPRNLDSASSRALIEAGADVNLKNKEGISPQMLNDKVSFIMGNTFHIRPSF